MSSLPWTKKPRRKPRRSEIRTGKRYEQAVAQHRLPIRSTSRARTAMSSRVAGLFLAMVLVAALAYLFLSDAYYVYDVTVQGNALVSAEEVFHQIGMEGYSVFFIDPRQAEARIRALPDVRDASVQVSLPNWVLIDVRERRAHIVWQTGEHRYGVDEDGLIVSLSGDSVPNIVVTDLEAAPLQLGEQVDLQVVAATKRYRSLLSDVSEFEYSREYGLSYLNGQGWRVYLGDGESAEKKIAIVDALVERLVSQAARVQSIDVRFPESPLYRLAEEPTAEP
jgi:cell division septal protein FtsQ